MNIKGKSQKAVSARQLKHHGETPMAMAEGRVFRTLEAMPNPYAYAIAQKLRRIDIADQHGPVKVLFKDGRRQHQKAECPAQGGNCGACDYCTFFVCSVCNGREASLTTECPGVRLTIDQLFYVACKTLDYDLGKWIEKRES